MKRKPVETKKTKMVLEPEQIILRPLVTEKGYHKSERTNAYCFEVNPLATKTDIKNAVEALFDDVKVDKVNTQTRKGKARRTRNGVSYTGDWKKAIVILNEEHNRIDYY